MWAFKGLPVEKSITDKFCFGVVKMLRIKYTARCLYCKRIIEVDEQIIEACNRIESKDFLAFCRKCERGSPFNLSDVIIDNPNNSEW
jgi:hypothetical protein